MKALILAAGYAVRLYPLTEQQAKPLLQVGGKAIIDYTLEKLSEVPKIKEVLVVTNNRFYGDFLQWKNGYQGTQSITIINDETQSNDARLGAIGDLHFVLQQYHLTEDLLVIAGDNLFGFSLPKLVHFFQQEASSVVAFHDMKDREKVKGKYGVGIMNNHTLLGFEEKPLNPSSSLASTACYLFTAADLQLVREFVKNGNMDAPGHLIRWLLEKSTVRGFVFEEPWFDVGSFESLREAEEVYRR